MGQSIFLLGRGARLLVASVILALVGSCNIFGHPYFAVYVVNESAQDVLLVAEYQGGCWVDEGCPGYRVPARTEALTATRYGDSAYGLPTGRALVFTADDCTLLGQTEFERLGTLLITVRTGGTVEFEPEPEADLSRRGGEEIEGQHQRCLLPDP